MRTFDIDIDGIALPPQPHRVDIDEDALRELADDIAVNGLINPIAVTEVGLGYRLEAGHRRLLAKRLLGHTTIRATVYDAADRVNGTAIRIAENLQRTDLTPMEEARALALAADELHFNQADLARLAHRSTDWVERRLALLDLPDELAALVHERRLATATALELARVTDDAHRAYLTRYALDAGATIATMRDWVREWDLARMAGNAAGAPRPEPLTPGQPIIIQIPCYVCATPYAHEHLRILRVCPRCTAAIAGAAAQDHAGADGSNVGRADQARPAAGPRSPDHRTDEERRRDAAGG